MKRSLAFISRQTFSLTALASSLAFLATPVLADSGASHKLRLERPIALGSSVSVDHLVNVGGVLYCTGGTAGALLTNGSSNLILSNNHVLANEGTEIVGVDGVVQPAILEECTTLSAINANIAEDRVAELAGFVDLKFDGSLNRADAAVAADLETCGTGSNDSCVDPNGYILDVGHISPDVKNPTVGMKVHKSGRTSGHTYGDIAAVNVTVNVQYDSGIATFTNQVRITSCSSKQNFSEPGDSGSLILSDPVSDRISGAPQPVALLFAGGRRDTFANLASDVLSQLESSGNNLGNLEFVGCTSGSCSFDYDDRASSFCATKTTDSGTGGNKGGRPRGNTQPVGIERAQQVADTNAAFLLGNRGVVGFGISQDEAGSAVIEIYVESLGASPNLPNQLGGVPVRVVETGIIYAY